MSFEGAISSLGATRAEDGSIDRVPDPPQQLWDKLAFLTAKVQTENIDLLSVFEEFGGNHHGIMKREKFCTALKDSFPRYHFNDELLGEICTHYGTGYTNPRGKRESVGWKDFCEDVHTARQHVSDAHWQQIVGGAARGKGETPGQPRVQPVLGWQPTG